MRVFVSSTYIDLIEYRRIIERSLRMSGFDFNGMEHFGSNPQPSIDVCLNAVESSDVFVGVLGMRYGSSPPRRIRSYSEREYMMAYQLHLPIYFFIIDEERALIRPTDIETNPDKIQRLLALKNRVNQRHTVSRFESPDNVAWLILASLVSEEIRIQETAQ